MCYLMDAKGLKGKNLTMKVNRSNCLFKNMHFYAVIWPASQHMNPAELPGFLHSYFIKYIHLRQSIVFIMGQQ